MKTTTSKITNMTNSYGDDAPNQFEIEGYVHFEEATASASIFQSYGNIIAIIDYRKGTKNVTLDAKLWNSSKTTCRYRSQFLNENVRVTKKKINAGEYALANLN